MSDIDSLPFPTFLISSNNDVNNNNNNNNINDHNNTSNPLSNPQNLTFANLNNILDLPKIMSLNNPCYVKELELGLEEDEDDDDDHQHRHHGFADHDILSSMSDIETPNWLRDEPMWLKDHEILLNCKNTMVDRHGSNGLSTRFPAIDHTTLSEKCFSATLGCKDNTMEVNSEPHDFTSQTSSFQQEGCDFTSCQTSSFHFESCDFTTCQTCPCRYENCSNTHVFSINLCKKDVEPQGFTSQTTSNFHENYNPLGTATTATATTAAAIATTTNTDILCQDDHNNFTSQTTSNLHENCGVLSIKCKDDVESPHGFTSQTISIAQEYCGESNVYKDSRPTCQDGSMASKMAHVNLGSKLGKDKGLIADSIDCDGITELQQDVMSVNNSPVIKDQQWSNNVQDPNLDQSTRNLIAIDETVNDCSVTSVGDDHPIQPFVAIDDTFKDCLAIELQDLTSFDTLNQNLSNVKTNDSSRINDSCAPTLGTQCIFSNCLSSNLATFPSPGDLYINYNQNVVDHGRLPPLVSLSTPRFSFHPQGTRDSHTMGIPLLCPSSSPQLRMTTLLTPLPSEATSSLAHNMFKQETIMNYKGNTIHQDDCLSSSFVSNDLANLHWRSPTAKTRAARKRRIAENRLPNQAVPSVQPARIKALDRTLALQMVPSQDKQTPTSEEKKMGIETNLRFLLQKELKPSDVGTLGRIVLPKRDAEAHLPDLTAREGITLSMEDIIDSRVWYLRFRFWPNNKSRMYLLENTRDFVKAHNLQEGDFLMLYKDDQAGKYVIQAKKVARLENSTIVTGRKIQRANVSDGRKSVSLTKNRKDRHRTVSRRNSTEKSSQKSPVKEDLIQGFHDDVSRLLSPQDNVDKIEIDDMNIEAIFELK